jgi:hypothetical protein
MDLPSVKFFTSNPSGTTTWGSKTNNRGKYTFNNFNLKNMLGDLYDKYDYFYLNLVSLSNSLSYALAAGNYNTIAVNVKVSGFNFINTDFNIKNSNYTNTATLGTFILKTTSNTATIPSITYWNDTSAVMFKKSPENFDIIVYFTQLLDDKAIAEFGASNYPFIQFYFEITPAI